LNTIKTTVRYAVYLFLLVAAAITFAGLNPAEEISPDAVRSESSQPETSLTSVKQKKPQATELTSG
jgi:hypothetical protein